MLNEAELRALLQRAEGQHLELKSLWEQAPGAPKPRDRRAVRDEIADYVAAFANADSGILVLGAEDDGALSGHGYPEDAIADFLETPNRRLEPVPSFRTQRLRLDGHELVVFEVDIAPRAVMVQGNGFPYRVQDRVVREQQEVINQRKQAWTTVGYERVQPPGVALDAIDLDSVRQHFARSPFAAREPLDNLRRLHLVEDSATGPRPTHAAILLFGKDPARLHPRGGVRVFRVSGTERTHGRHRNVQQFPPIEGRLPDVLAQAKERVGGLVRKSEKLHDLFFREMPEYPTEAWQEALVNAVAHRDYLQQGLGIEVTLFDDRMEIESPGDLVPPVTLEALNQGQRVHASRNPLICRALTEVGIMREEGEGVLRMREELRESMLPPPEFELRQGRVCITFRNTPQLLGGPPGWSAVLAQLPLQDNQRRVLVQFPDGFRSKDYQQINGVDRDVAYREIQELVNQGIIANAEAPGRGAIYRLRPAYLARFLLLRERVSGLLEHFRRAATLTTSGYMQRFGLSRSAASRELGRLVNEGMLIGAGRGRGAHYGPSPALRRLLGEGTK